MNPDGLLSWMFDVLEAFLAQIEASLVLAARPVSAVALDTRSILRKLVFHFNMTVYRSHRKLLKRIASARRIPESAPALVRI